MMKILFLSISAVALLALIASDSYAEPLGACCIPPTYECYVLTEEECTEQGGIWFAYDDCEPLP